jgi:hypothetical protein
VPATLHSAGLFHDFFCDITTGFLSLCQELFFCQFFELIELLDGHFDFFPLDEIRIAGFSFVLICESRLLRILFAHVIVVTRNLWFVIKKRISREFYLTGGLLDSIALFVFTGVNPEVVYFGY